MPDHRIVSANGAPIAYTCENKRFMTNLEKGKAHAGYSNARGNVFDHELAAPGGLTLWLEHVVDKQNGEELYWLMWYDQHGVPTIPLSGVMGKAEVQEMAGRLAGFVP